MGAPDRSKTRLVPVDWILLMLAGAFAALAVVQYFIDGPDIVVLLGLAAFFGLCAALDVYRRSNT